MEIQELLESTVQRAGAGTVYGQPVQAEGKTVIPVAKIGFGFGLGTGRKEPPKAPVAAQASAAGPWG